MNAIAIDIVLTGITILLLFIEWIKRSRSARILLAVGAATLILANYDLGPSARRALATKDRVTVRWDRQLSEYVSGVLTMKREAERQTSDIVWPALVLVWLSVSPVLPGIGRRAPGK